MSRQRKLAIAGAVALWFAIWIAWPLFMDPEIPSDNLEQLDWARNPAWGFAKHPPLPTLVLWCFEQVFPASIPLTYVLGALQVAFMLWIAWLLARATLRSTPPWIVPLMIACITYYTSRMHYYNHNTALVAAYAAAAYAAWQAVTYAGWRWWLMLGAAWGAGMLSKYEMAVLIASNLLFFWNVRAIGRVRLLKGVALASIVAGAMLVPHLIWLYWHHFPSFAYASISLNARLDAAERVQTMVNFAIHQIGRLAPLLLFLLILAWRGRSADQHPAAAHLATPDDWMVKRFYLIHAWGPLVAILALGACFGVAVENHWGMASLWVVPLWLCTTGAGRRQGSTPVQFVLQAFLIVQLLTLAGYSIGS